MDRAWKIERFVAEDFWSISMTVDRGLDGRAVFDWNRGRLFDCDSCLSLYEEMLESAEAVVTSVRENIKRKWKPPPLSTTDSMPIPAVTSHTANTLSVPYPPGGRP